MKCLFFHCDQLDGISLIVPTGLALTLNMRCIDARVRPGADPGGSGPGGQDTPPPPFWGTPKLHKEGKNVARMLAKTPRFST